MNSCIKLLKAKINFWAKTTLSCFLAMSLMVLTALFLVYAFGKILPDWLLWTFGIVVWLLTLVSIISCVPWFYYAIRLKTEKEKSAD